MRSGGAHAGGGVQCLRFLRSVVRSEGEALSANQELVFDALVSVSPPPAKLVSVRARVP